MIKKILSYFKGDRKYFSIVFFILVLIFVVGIIAPNIIESKKSNWDTELSKKILDIESGITRMLSEKESELISVKNQIKDELHKSLVNTDYEYGNLISIVNKKNYEDFSIQIVAPNGKIIAWSYQSAIKQEEIFPFVYPINEVHFFNASLITYMTIIDTVILHGDRFYLLTSIPVEKHYSLQNKYYKQISFTEELSAKYKTLFTVHYDPYALPSKDGRVHSVILMNSEKSKIGLASFFKPSLNFEISEIQETAARIQILLLVIGLFFLTLGIRSDFQTIKWKSLRLFSLIVYLAAIRLVLFWADFPTRFLDGPLVDSANFSSVFAGGLVKSPTEFFVTNVFLLIIGLKFFQYSIEYFNEKSFKGFILVKAIIAPLFIIVAFYTIRGLSASIKSVVFDSTIRYFKEPDLIPSLPALMMNLNILLLGLSSVAVIIGFLLLAGKSLNLLNRGKPAFLFVIYFVIIQIACFIFFRLQPEPLITAVMHFAFVALIFLIIAIITFKQKHISVNIIFSSLIASVIVISMLNYFNLELERRSLKIIAYEVNRTNKDLVSYLVDETLRNALQSEELLASLFKLNSNYNSQAFIAWSKSSLQRESLGSQLSIFDRNFRLLGRFSVGFDENIDYKKIWGKRNDRSIFITEIEASPQSGVSFAGIAPVERNNIIAAYIAVSAKFTIENLGASEFPDFLESNKAALGSVIDLNNVRIFEYSDGKLLRVKGNIIPSKEQRAEIFNVELSDFGDGWADLSFYGEDYLTYILRTNWEGVDKTTVVAIKKKEITWSLYNFFKIFIVHSAFILILVAVLLLFRILRLRYTFRTRLLSAFLLVSIIPIIALAVYNREVVRERTNTAILNELSKRSEYLENHIKVQLQKHTDRYVLTAFENAGKELGIAFTIYENSDMLFSSRKEFFDNRLIPAKLNSEVHYKLNYLSYNEVLTKESINNYIYDAYYRKIELDSRSFILGVNDAFNKIELFYSPVDADVFLFGVYSFAVIIITLLSTLFANQISSPIRQLTRATNAVAQGDLSVQLDNKEKGELKELLDGFNAMTQELQKNQKDIAELERENAWKEMAKQVAHEIKNPLTPMKLSVQQLIAAFDDKNTRFDEIFKKLSHAILNQIENLNLISSEFSYFAKMPSLKLEEFDLIPVIKDTIHLFGDEEAKIKFSTDIDRVIVESDSSQMRRMFINLIRNSIQAKASEIDIKLKSEDKTVQIEILDNGTGIAPENLNRIFEANFTTKEKGLGLGLKLAKRFLENTGGEIKLISSTHDGTHFRIRIPFRDTNNKNLK